MLRQVPFYCIPRTEDDRREQLYDRSFEMALRWHPCCPEVDPDGLGVDPELIETGKTTLRRLVQGDTVSQEHLNVARRYLDAAVSFYSIAVWEPYPRRNAEALHDMTELLELLSEVTQ